MKEEMSTEFPFLDMPLLAESESEWKWSFSAIAQLYTKLCDGSGMKYSPIWPCLLDSNAREQQHLYLDGKPMITTIDEILWLYCMSLSHLVIRQGTDKTITTSLPYYVPNCMWLVEEGLLVIYTKATRRPFFLCHFLATPLKVFTVVTTLL